MMTNQTLTRLACSVVVVGALIATTPAALVAQTPVPGRPAPTAPARGGLGLDVFGGAGISWPAAKDSFDAVGFGSEAFDVGGGARVTGLFGKLFAQVAVARWSDTGERAFVAEDGTAFPLGIPLEVNATFIDGTIGVKQATFNSKGRLSFSSYAGIGAGVVRYKESSPFAESGDDLDTSQPSYHALLGVEVPVHRLLALAVDGRYRYIPGLLGDGGTSGSLEEDLLGGFQTSVGLRLGFGGPASAPPSRRANPPATPSTSPTPDTPGKPEVQRTPEGVITQAAPVFILPDATRTPLRTLSAGMTVRVLEEKGDWVRVEWNDSQYGRRVGYVQRKFVTRRAP